MDMKTKLSKYFSFSKRSKLLLAEIGFMNAGLLAALFVPADWFALLYANSTLILIVVFKQHVKEFGTKFSPWPLHFIPYIIILFSLDQNKLEIDGDTEFFSGFVIGGDFIFIFGLFIVFLPVASLSAWYSQSIAGFYNKSLIKFRNLLDDQQQAEGTDAEGSDERPNNKLAGWKIALIVIAGIIFVPSLGLTLFTVPLELILLISRLTEGVSSLIFDSNDNSLYEAAPYLIGIISLVLVYSLVLDILKTRKNGN